MSPRGRPRVTEHCDEIAALLHDGHGFPRISDEVGISQSLVKKRVDTMRHLLATETDDAAWIVKTQRTNVEVARAWIKRAEERAANPEGPS